MSRPLATSFFDRIHAHPLFRAHSRKAVIFVPYAWLLIFFMLPFFIILKISVSEGEMFPYAPLLTFKEGVAALTINVGHYAEIVQDAIYFQAYAASLKYAAITTFWCLFIGYPFAYFMARAKASVQPALMMMVMLPFWTSFLLRVFAWKGLLVEDGLISNLLMWLNLDDLLLKLGIIHEAKGWSVEGVLLSFGLIEAPGKFMYTPFSLLIGMIYTYLPFMILPLYATLSKMDLRLLEAAADLGATPWVGFWKITVPLSKAGIIAGSMLVFIPCIGEYVIPELLGGPRTYMIGKRLWDEFFSNNDWPMAASVAVMVILLIIVPLALFNKYQAEATEVRS
jgi:putrescine transport system permease protein